MKDNPQKPDEAPKTEAEAIQERLAADAEKDAAAVENAKEKAKTIAAAKAKPKRRAKPQLDAAKLRELIAVVEGGYSGLQRKDLLHRLQTEEGADLKSGDGPTKLVLAGVTSLAATDKQALANWCAAARRKCLSGEAV